MPMLSKLRDFAELMRVANVFTAISNVWMGMIFTTGHLPGWGAVGITATSALLYLAGMVLNDVFDHRLDAVERPERPIPSGRVSLGAARVLGWGLLVLGVVAGGGSSYLSPDSTPFAFVASVALAVFIVTYDAWGKRTMFAAPLMGICRGVNVMLGCSIAPLAAWPVSPIPATGVGAYVIGVTLFARSEATVSSRTTLIAGAGLSLLGLGCLAAMPWLGVPGRSELVIEPIGWIVLWIVVAGTILRRMVVAILQPSPKYVQRAVGHAVLSIIVVDAAICLGYASPFWALAVLALLAPATLLAQFLKVT